MTLNEIYILETGNETFADNCEQIADDYAIEFAEWCDDNYFRSGKCSSNWVASLGWYDDKKFTTSVLLEIFKKEKGL
jgi:hypothetical protein